MGFVGRVGLFAFFLCLIEQDMGQVWYFSCADDPVASLNLCLVERDIRFVDQFVAGRSILGETGKPQAHRGVDRGRTADDRKGGVFDCVANALRNFGCRGLICVGQENGVFFPPKAAGHIFFAHCLHNNLGDPGDHCIPGQMSIGIVDVAQQVQIAHDDRQGLVMMLGMGQFFFKAFLEIAGIPQPCLAVGLALFLQLRQFEHPLEEDEGCQHQQKQPGSQYP